MKNKSLRILLFSLLTWCLLFSIVSATHIGYSKVLERNPHYTVETDLDSIRLWTDGKYVIIEEKRKIFILTDKGREFWKSYLNNEAFDKADRVYILFRWNSQTQEVTQIYLMGLDKNEDIVFEDKSIKVDNYNKPIYIKLFNQIINYVYDCLKSGFIFKPIDFN